MKTPKQQDLESEIRYALQGFNRYLTLERAAFALTDGQLERISFLFVARPLQPESDPGSEIIIDEVPFQDRYWVGRKLGQTYHKTLNPSFFKAVYSSEKEKKRMRKVTRAIEHTFAMLYIRSEEEDANLELLVDEPHARDPQDGYSLLLDKDKETTFEPQKPAIGIEKYLQDSYKLSKEEKEKKEEDHRFDPNQAKDFGYEDVSFEAPDELKEYEKFESIGGMNDDPLSIALDKAKREEFTLGRIIVEGRGGDKTWKTTVPRLLTYDLATAIPYLKEILKF